MLSGETTVGKYPLKCIEVFDASPGASSAAATRQFHDLAELNHGPAKAREERRGDGQ